MLFHDQNGGYIAESGFDPNLARKLLSAGGHRIIINWSGIGKWYFHLLCFLHYKRGILPKGAGSL